MFKLDNERGGTRRIVQGRIAVALAALAMALPIAVLAGLFTDDAAQGVPTESRKGSGAVIQEKSAKPGGNYRIRCWQYGRLLFEENEVVLPSDLSPYSVKIRGTDRNGSPVYVADTKNATCILQVPAVRARTPTP